MKQLTLKEMITNKIKKSMGEWHHKVGGYTGKEHYTDEEWEEIKRIRKEKAEESIRRKAERDEVFRLRLKEKQERKEARELKRKEKEEEKIRRQVYREERRRTAPERNRIYNTEYQRKYRAAKKLQLI
jgi:hypothetical protein